MGKRLLAGPLWYVAVLAAYELAWVVLSVPRQLGPVFAISISALVVLDPAGLLWPAPASPRQSRAGITAVGRRAPRSIPVAD